MSLPTLRNQHADLTRELILRTLARLVSQEGVHDFSIQRVADLAGLSHRTVYRHFQTRDELLEALAAWLESRMPRDLDSFRADELEDAIPMLHQLFEDHAEHVTALAVLAAGARIRVPRRKAHTRTARRALADVVRDLDPEDAGAVVTLIRAIVGSHMWSHLRNEHHLDREHTTRAVTWAASTLVTALKAGKGPKSKG
ncbi:MAG TPA: helix-turn-helix domain-containing protein [Vicinamibacterales bacterium]|jgi:AcrR family transcriptional regulator